jgi:hypothetical protein
MKVKKEPILLVNKVKRTTIYDPPEPLGLIMAETKKAKHYPFPLSLEQQFELLYLMRSRRSGIITREELQDLIFTQPTLH